MSTQQGPGAYTRPFPPPRDFSSVSIRDLLDAREAHHVQLSNIPTVVATAIGRYRIHRDDWYAQHPPNQPRPQDVPRVHAARTLENSVVRPWSWPCVMVFVSEWGTQGRYERVPSRLYLPDGCVVPTCVLYAKPDEELAGPAPQLNFASEMIGGGYSCLRTAQSITRQGTIACLVEREGNYYALTNRHVAGPDEGAVEVIVRGNRVKIGTSEGRHVGRLEMRDVFPEWPTSRTLLNIDAGLVRLDDVRFWTSQVFGIGEIADPFDATTASLTLDLIGCPLRAYGGSSGVLLGEIQALFVQYRTLNGFQYVTDLLIGRRKSGEDTHGTAFLSSVDSAPGDSGTLWFYDPPNNPPQDIPYDPDLSPPEPEPERGRKARRLRPIAMQWGGQRLRGPDGEPVSHALATFISTVCRVLDVEIVRGYATGHDEYWGKTGHFSIGWKACDRIDRDKYPKLAKLMSLNQRRIGFDDHRLIQGSGFRNGANGFVPLADVPDYVFGFGGKLGPNQHFADIDIRAVDGTPSLAERYRTDKTSLSATVWAEYFGGFASHDVGPDEGALPFRVWQFWNLMIEALRVGSTVDFVTAAGIMAHFVGDASQPLHGSWLHHGRAPAKKTIERVGYPYRHGEPGYDEFHGTDEAKIHAIYEQQMLEVDTPTVLGKVNQELAGRPIPRATVANGWQAACAAMDLIEGARARLAPDDIIDADDPSLAPHQRAARLWDNATVRDATIASLADSTQTLAQLWMSAWHLMDGEHKLGDADVRGFTEAELMRVYKKRGYAHAQSLADLARTGDFEPEE
jgi:hypothetical protein